jgi:hypothetical protein
MNNEHLPISRRRLLAGTSAVAAAGLLEQARSADGRSRLNRETNRRTDERLECSETADSKTCALNPIRKMRSFKSLRPSKRRQISLSLSKHG